MRGAAGKVDVGEGAMDAALLAMLRVLDPASSAIHRLQVLKKVYNCMRRGIAANIVCCCRSRACFSPSYTRLTQPTLTKMMKLNVMALLFAFSCSIVSWQV